MTTEEVFEEYGDEPLFFSHYYNFIFVYKSARLGNGDQIFYAWAGTWRKCLLWWSMKKLKGKLKTKMDIQWLILAFSIVLVNYERTV